jgi:hypothetical protein
VEVRNFSQHDLSAYKGDRAFQYDRINEPPKSLWNRIVNWIFSRINLLFQRIGSGGALSWILLILAAGIVVFCLIKISGMTDGGIFGKQSTKKMEYVVNDENIYSINFDEAIQQAVANRNFRLALRLMYLQVLRNLAEKEIIEWKINKTNLAYLAELTNTDYHADFSQLTKHFENSWYGDVPITESELSILKPLFANFSRQL